MLFGVVMCQYRDCGNERERDPIIIIIIIIMVIFKCYFSGELIALS